MKNFTKTIFFTGVCSVVIIFTNLSNTMAIKKAIEDKEAIEKRAYKKLTKENKELIEYIVFGENQN